MKSIIRSREFLHATFYGFLLATFSLSENVQGQTESRALEKIHFNHAIELETSSETSANISIGDINSDGHLDILLIKGRHWPLLNQILLGDGIGNFQNSYPLSDTPDRSYSGNLFDMDGDGDLDIVVSNDFPDPNYVYLNDGSGNFTIHSEFGNPEWPTRHVGLGDMNSDGLADIIVANRSGMRDDFNYICYNQGNAVFTQTCTEIARASTTTITNADFNADGLIDLIVPHRERGQSYIYLNDFNNTFKSRIAFGPEDAGFRKAETADFDGDGHLDIIAIDQREGPVIYLSGPNRDFEATIRLGRPGLAPYALAVADLNGDNWADIVIGYIEARPEVYFNAGNSDFSRVEFGDNMGTAYGFAFGDMNGDGLIDISMARSDAQNMLYFGSHTDN